MKSIVIELMIPGKLKNEPIICDIIRKFRVDIKIIEASFSAESGWAIIGVSGDPEEVDRMCDYLKAKDITIEPQKGMKF
ncbi:MAG: NIL domain-containing protein [Candidatus Omnitrophica bacterium]|nr:NIL domain-containing protein [Candidatus Omnitrophota bacterium]